MGPGKAQSKVTRELMTDPRSTHAPSPATVTQPGPGGSVAWPPHLTCPGHQPGCDFPGSRRKLLRHHQCCRYPLDVTGMLEPIIHSFTHSLSTHRAPTCPDALLWAEPSANTPNRANVLPSPSLQSCRGEADTGQILEHGMCQKDEDTEGEQCVVTTGRS